MVHPSCEWKRMQKSVVEYSSMSQTIGNNVMFELCFEWFVIGYDIWKLLVMIKNCVRGSAWWEIAGSEGRNTDKTLYQVCAREFLLNFKGCSTQWLGQDICFL
jgi:hypothetical protein